MTAWLDEATLNAYQNAAASLDPRTTSTVSSQLNFSYNEANSEHNRDGNNDNRSWNCSVEGLTAAQVFQAAVENAPRELRRSSQKLAFSGIAGGLTMGPTGLAVAAVHAFTVPCESLPLAPYLLYSIGLVAVIIGRAQLFTENTLCLLQRFQISEDCLSI